MKIYILAAINDEYPMKLFEIVVGMIPYTQTCINFGINSFDFHNTFEFEEYFGESPRFSPRIQMEIDRSVNIWNESSSTDVFYIK